MAAAWFVAASATTRAAVSLAREPSAAHRETPHQSRTQTFAPHPTAAAEPCAVERALLLLELSPPRAAPGAEECGRWSRVTLCPAKPSSGGTPGQHDPCVGASTLLAWLCLLAHWHLAPSEEYTDRPEPRRQSSRGLDLPYAAKHHSRNSMHGTVLHLQHPSVLHGSRLASCLGLALAQGHGP